MNNDGKYNGRLHMIDELKRKLMKITDEREFNYYESKCPSDLTDACTYYTNLVRLILSGVSKEEMKDLIVDNYTIKDEKLVDIFINLRLQYMDMQKIGNHPKLGDTN